MNAKTRLVISDILTMAMAILPAVDSIFHTHIVSAGWYTTVLAFLGAAGIHATTTDGK
jgi:hypothetical protein